ncbi:hypothetical protein [Pseudonocardia sp. KRD291]|uniref:hypothetical protein n=1 Tax=Pseudonocardia sp. KRD291 TaxID=2792007 RepID=UPI001C4A6674|nr:hypothetical protein [Pseudonocardia sp. KRD291]MBW0104170.1 hypothetical protein [Pseudonocardia sp. KRD291]
MTASVPPIQAFPSPRATLSRHRPLMVLAVAMAALTVVGVVGMVADPRTVTGLGAWDKPTKFAVSVAIYAVTWSWLAEEVRSRRGRARGVHAAGTVAAVLLAVEMVVIVVQAVRGTTSHFNVSTPFDAAMWTAMAVSIVVVWLATMYLAAGLFGLRGGDPARTFAIRSGAVLALVGMGLGFLMTSPTTAQLADFRGIAGAHTVGLPDGGPGLALLGWSTAGGDLRVPHFLGMHALQAIPLLLIGLELLAARGGVLASSATRLRLVGIGTAAYAAVVALTTWQALRGQPLVAPDAVTVSALAVIVVAAAVGVALVLRSSGTRPRPAPVTPAAGAPS